MIKNYFAEGNTSLGFYSLFEDAVKGLERLYILIGGPGTGKSTIMKDIGELMSNEGFDVDYYHCSLDKNSLNGVIIPTIKLGVIDGTTPHLLTPKYPGIVEEIINLGEYWDTNIIRKNRLHIVKLTNDIKDKTNQAYEQFADAKLIHDEWEQIYLSSMNFNKANQITEEFIKDIFCKEVKREHKPVSKNIFFGSATSEGYVHYIENITENIKKRYIIKGRPGTGKSTMMKKIGKHAEKLGLSVEYYPCGFDPNSIDMVLIPSLSIAVVDGTAPHVINPSRANDEIIDMFALCINPKVEIENEKELNSIETRYRIKMTIATNYLKEAKKANDKLKAHYIKAMDFEAINNRKSELINQIISYSKITNKILQN